jgi:hypothetical protein
MVKIGFNCQLPLSEIGLTTDSEPKELELHLFCIQDYVFPRPFETPKNGQIPFLRNTYKIRHYKKDNGNPTIHYFIYQFHSNRNTCPAETEFVTCYPLA